MKIRVADYIMSRLIDAGTDTVFLLSGGGMMHLADAVGRRQELRYICNHHEQASTIAADAYARRTGKIGVCMATSGPGATNTLTGLVGAYQDSSPVLCLTGQVKTTQTIHCSGIEGLRQFGTFEVDIVPIVSSVTKYAAIVTDPKTIRYHLEKALFLAQNGRPGPVLLDIPLDVQGASVETDELEGFTPPEPTACPASELGKIVDVLAKAKRPLILAGVGIRSAGAVEAFQKLIEKLGVPVAVTQLGKDVLPYAHPQFVGHPGPKGDRAGNFAVQTADLILALGCSLHSQTIGWEDDLFAPKALKIMIDPDPAILAREHVNVGLKIQCGVKEVIAALLLSAAAQPQARAWLAKCADWKERYSVRKEPHDRSGEGVNYYDLIDLLSSRSKGDECIVADAGSSFYVMGQAFRLKAGQRFISSGSLGAMGFGLPAANGAAVAGGGAVICVTGDGSLMTNIHDLATMSRHKLNVKLFVVNNDGYMSIRNTQRAFFGGLLVGTDSASGVFIPSIEKLTRSYDLPFLCCDRLSSLDDVIKEAMATEGPVVVEVRGIRDQLIIPSVTSIRLPNGRMQSKPLHDMVPFLPPEQVEAELASVGS